MQGKGKHYWFKVFAYAALLGAILLVGSTSLVHAQFEGLAGFAGSAGATAAQSGATTWKGVVTAVVGSAFDNIGYYIIGKIAFGVSYMIAWIAGILIAIEAWVVGVILGMNTGVFQADVVQKGFAATLSIANLGFVLGIIIIAIATILHRETYGYKKILWKLVAAAILVNFSLVIAAPIFNLGNSFTTYFLNCVDPGGGGCNGQGAAVSLTGKNSMNDFAANLAGAFNPQVGLIDATGTSFDTVNSSVSLGQSFGKMLIPILSIGFVAAELVAIVIVLGALIAMLIVRYVYVAILLVLMPFAWLGWVFPVIKDWWSKWWHQFIRWTFFPAIVVFFLWLAMATAQSMRNGTAVANQQFGTYTSNSNPIWAPIAEFIGNAFNPIIAQVLNTLVLLGLSIGGLIVADRMSLAGSKAIIGTATAAAKGVGNYATKQSKKVGRATFRKVGGERAVQALRSGQVGEKLKNVPLVGGAAAWVGSSWPVTRVGSVVGRAADKHLDNKEMVEAAKKNVPDDVQKIKDNLKGNMNMEDNLAHVAKLNEKGALSEDVMVGRRSIKDFMDDNKRVIEENYGSTKISKDADKALGSDKAMRDAERGLVEKLSKGVTVGSDEYKDALNKLDDATKEFLAKLEKGDMSKMNVNEVFNKDNLMAKALARNMAKTAPQLIGGAIPKMKSPTLKNFKAVFESETKAQLADPKTTPEERDMITLAMKSFKKSYLNNTVSAGPGETPAAGGAAPAPAGGSGGSGGGGAKH